MLATKTLRASSTIRETAQCGLSRCPDRHKRSGERAAGSHFVAHQQRCAHRRHRGSVSVTSSLLVNAIRLFVDGQEVGYQNDTETNFVVNTCQFGNGSHKIYAVVESSTGSETTGESPRLRRELRGLTIRIRDFRQLHYGLPRQLRFQDPDETETNRFSAKFAAYADWTLTITNQDGVASARKRELVLGWSSCGTELAMAERICRMALIGGSLRN